MTKREDRLAAIAAELRQRKLTPDSTLFRGVVQRIACGDFLTTTNVAQQDADTLTVAYKRNKWSVLLGESGETTELEPNDSPPSPPSPTLAPTQFKIIEQDRTEIHQILSKLENSNSPEIKLMPQKTATQPDKISDETLAQILYRMAKDSTGQENSTARIVLFDVRDAADNKHLSIQDALAIWQQFYPTIQAEAVNSTIIKVYFDGKDALKDKIKLQAPIIPEAYSFGGKKEATKTWRH